jgi:hypothetical protein
MKSVNNLDSLIQTRFKTAHPIFELIFYIKQLFFKEKFF